MSNLNQSLGESRVRVSFNPSRSSLVDQFKIKSAELIDILDRLRNDEASKHYGKTPEEYHSASFEVNRLIDKAQDSIEEAAMWGVKAITSVQ